jgi:hypothetical protein
VLNLPPLCALEAHDKPVSSLLVTAAGHLLTGWCASASPAQLNAPRCLGDAVPRCFSEANEVKFWRKCKPGDSTSYGSPAAEDDKELEAVFATPACMRAQTPPFETRVRHNGLSRGVRQQAAGADDPMNVSNISLSLEMPPGSPARGNV